MNLYKQIEKLADLLKDKSTEILTKDFPTFKNGNINQAELLRRTTQSMDYDNIADSLYKILEECEVQNEQ